MRTRLFSSFATAALIAGAVSPAIAEGKADRARAAIAAARAKVDVAARAVLS